MTEKVLTDQPDTSSNSRYPVVSNRFSPPTIPARSMPYLGSREKVPQICKIVIKYLIGLPISGRSSITTRLRRFPYQCVSHDPLIELLRLCVLGQKLVFPPHALSPKTSAVQSTAETPDMICFLFINIQPLSTAFPVLTDVQAQVGIR